MPSLTFIRFSFNGGTRENYSSIRRVKPEVFDDVVRNIKEVVKIKAKNGLSVDVGAQYVLLPENKDNLIDAINVLKNVGIDYFVIKPFVHQSIMQSYKMNAQMNYDDVNDTLNKAEGYSDDNFKVVARRESFEDYGKRKYWHCYGTSFISVLNSAGDIASCLPYWEKEEFVFGNIYKNSFKEIWYGEKRKEIKKRLECKLDVSACPPNCRPNAINEFLWEIKSPSVKHLNFI